MSKSRHQGNEHYFRMDRKTMSRPAWKALSPAAQALYPWFKMEWKGPQENNNGRIRLSVRQAAKCIGVTSPDTAARAIHDLQRKGWLFVYRKAALGVDGEARGHEYEITEIALPDALASKEDRQEGRSPRPRCLYQFWDEDNEFPVAEVRSNNPTGKNSRKQNPVPKIVTTDESHVPIIGTGRPENRDEQAEIEGSSVPKIVTSLSPGGVGDLGVVFKKCPPFSALSEFNDFDTGTLS